MDLGAVNLPEYRALDVAEAILQRTGPLNPITLHKMLYFVKSWSLGWNAGPVFRDAMQAWANGPVVPAVYQRHRRQGLVNPGEIEPDPEQIDAKTRQIINNIVDFYRRYTPDQLIALTHHDSPWRNARARDGALPGERSAAIIKRADMREYYRDLANEANSRRMPRMPEFLIAA